MTIDPKQSFLLAFRNLDNFSVPGLGTFKKVYQPAVIDHLKGKINPPGNKFVLEEGQNAVKKLQEYLANTHKLDAEKSQLAVKNISDWAQDELTSKLSFSLPGVGEIVKENDGKLSLIGTSLTGLGAGLESLDYTLGKSKIPVKTEQKPVPKPDIKKEKKEEESMAIAHDITLKESKLDRLKKKEGRGGEKSISIKEKKKRRIPVLPIIIGVVLLLLAGSGFFFKAQLSSYWSGLGLFSSSEHVDEVHEVEDIPAVDTTDTVEELIETEDFVDDTPIAVNIDVANVGEYPSENTFYLIISSTRSGYQADQMATNVGGSVVKPYSASDYFRVSVFSSTSKDAVIQKMVQLKSQFPEGTWIYWSGM